MDFGFFWAVAEKLSSMGPAGYFAAACARLWAMVGLLTCNLGPDSEGEPKGLVLSPLAYSSGFDAFAMGLMLISSSNEILRPVGLCELASSKPAISASLWMFRKSLILADSGLREANAKRVEGCCCWLWSSDTWSSPTS